MSLKIDRRRLLLVLLTGLAANVPVVNWAATPPDSPGGDAGIPKSALLEPGELVRMLGSTGNKPLVLQVGVHVLYAQAHVPGSEYVGAADSSEGLDALRRRVAQVNKDRLIVIYCGCCPWQSCPNIRPAFKQLAALGFTRVKALHLPENFGTDWVDKGYPIESGR
jgi:hypothetical protein